MSIPGHAALFGRSVLTGAAEKKFPFVKAGGVKECAFR